MLTENVSSTGVMRKETLFVRYVIRYDDGNAYFKSVALLLDLDGKAVAPHKVCLCFLRLMLKILT